MPPTEVRRERARPMSPEERRAAIVEATVPLVIEHGAGVTTRLVAEAAGIAEGTIFRVFPDMRALFHAVAAHVLDPPGSADDLAAELDELTGLPDKIIHVVTQMEERSYKVMVVMMALRQVWVHDGPPTKDHQPPDFIVKSHQALLDRLTTLLFVPHADELRVPPEDAAIALRALVLGARHPAMKGSERRLTPTQVADLILHGITKGTS